MRLRTLVPVLAATCLWGADPAPTPPAVEVSLADGAVLLDHLAASPLGRAWADPACAPLQRRLEVLLSYAEEGVELPLLPTLRALHRTRLRIDAAGRDPGLPALQATASFTPELAQQLVAMVAEHAPEAEEAEVPGADDALVHQGVLLVRRGGTLDLAANAAAEAGGMAAAQAAAGDLAAVVRLRLLAPGLRALAQRMGANEKTVADLDRIFAQLEEQGLTTGTYRMDIAADGIHERLVGDSPNTPGCIPVDRGVFARLPATTLMGMAVGIDGATYWKHLQAQLAAEADAEGLAKLDAVLAGAGITATTGELIASLRGTCLLAITQGIPFPGFCAAVPRSAILDQAIAALLERNGLAAPAEGASLPIPLPVQVPVLLNLVRDRGHWLLSSDAGLSSSWAGGQPGGWADTTAAATLLAAAPASAYALGASDTPAVLRTLAGYLGMAMGFAKDADPAVKEELQAGLALVQRLAAISPTGYVYAAAEDGRTVTEGRGVLGAGGGQILLLGVVGGAIAVQRQAGGEMPTGMQAAPDPATGAALLRSELFPAEVQFQAGAYIDQDHDGRGEFGQLEELAGLCPAGDRTLALISRELGENADGDWELAVFLPDADNGVLPAAGAGQARIPLPAAADLQERRFVAYAWPRHAAAGLMLAITETGTLYAAPYEGEPPTFDALFGMDGGGWNAAPVWEPYRKAEAEEAPAAPVPPAAQPGAAGDPLM